MIDRRSPDYIVMWRYRAKNTVESPGSCAAMAIRDFPFRMQMPTSRRPTRALSLPAEPARPLRPRAAAAQVEYDRLMAEAKAEFDRVTTQHLIARSRGQKDKKVAAPAVQEPA